MVRMTDKIDADLSDWGNMMEMDVRGLSALGYPSGPSEAPSGAGFPVPNYFPNGRLNALHRVIEGLDSKYRDLLVLKYAVKLNDRAIHREGLCHFNSIPKRLKEVKEILLKSRYWDT